MAGLQRPRAVAAVVVLGLAVIVVLFFSAGEITWAHLWLTRSPESSGSAGAARAPTSALVVHPAASLDKLVKDGGDGEEMVQKAQSAPGPAWPGSDSTQEWKALKRDKRDVIRQFIMAPSTIRAEELLRSPELNPRDTPVEPSQRKILRSIVDFYAAHLKSVRIETQAIRNEELKRLRQEGNLIRLSRESLGGDAWNEAQRAAAAAPRVNGLAMRPEDHILSNTEKYIPWAEGALTDATGTWVSRRDQMGLLAGHMEYYAYVKEVFFNTVVFWFVDRHVLGPNEGSRLAGEFSRRAELVKGGGKPR